ncbi:MAG: Ig-like domain-containing protein [Bacteroidetes bacterium]|nr:Ig-like domain-containing protein [Bacteroidota bacterium]
MRDTISISPRHVSRVETDGEFVAPETGAIMIGPYELDEIADSPLPDSACVKISVNDTLRYRFDLIPFFGADGNAEVFSSQVPFYNQCTDQYATFIWSGYVYWWYNFDNHPDSIYVIKINKGDTLSFVYEARWEATGTGWFYEYPNGTIIGGVDLHGHPSDDCWESNTWGAIQYPGDWLILRLRYRQGYNLKILSHAPWSIWPTLLPGGVTTRPGYKNEANTLVGYRPERGFTVLVTDAQGSPVKNAAVEITQDYQKGTGGHAHAASSDVTPPPSLQGTFYGQGASGPSIRLTTDQDGMAVVDKYVASQISGTYLITAYLVSDPSVKDTVNLNVQVPALVNFRDLIFLPRGEEPYTLAQATQAAVNNHPDNDYCTPAMGDSLFLAVLDFYDWSASPAGGGVPIKISLNDMSLPWGGVYDIDADWRSPHQLHRIGRSVDINNGGLYQEYNSNHPSLAMMTKLGKELQRWMNFHQGYRIPEGRSVHYEFYEAH